MYCRRTTCVMNIRTISSVHNQLEGWELALDFLSSFLSRFIPTLFLHTFSKCVTHYDTFTEAPCKDVSGLKRGTITFTLKN